MSHRWTRRCLSRDDGEILEGAGPAILWIDGDLAVPGRHDPLSATTGDIVIAERAILRAIPCTGAWSAQVLYLADRRVLQHVNHGRPPGAVAFGGGTRLAKTLKQVWAIGDEWSAAGTDDRMIGTALIDLVTELATRMVAESTEARVPTQALETVERARALIRSHLADPEFGVAELARLMRLSARHLSALFAPFGTTTARAIMEMRVARGKALLADPVNARRQVADIALACGFSDQNYFARCFQRFVRQTPNAFRRTCRNQDVTA